MSPEDLSLGQIVEGNAVDTDGVAATPAAGKQPEGAARSGRLRSVASAVTDRGVGEDAPTKAFEAPHKLRKETFLTHLAGLTLLSFWKTASWIMGHIPPGPAYKVGGALAMIGYAASPQRRRWLRSNFGHVLGVSPKEKAASGLARRAYRNYARYILELMRLPWLKPGQIDVFLSDADLKRFVDTYRDSDGVILVAAHLGNNEAAASGFVKHGYTINVVGDDSSFVELFELFERQRAMWGIKMISWRNLRGVYAALRRKEALVLLVDWGYRADDMPVKMFDGWTTLPAGPALLAAKHGSAILPFCVNRLPNGNFRVIADEPIKVPSDSPADLAIGTQKIATALEQHIRPAPEQWYIFKPIWPQSAAEAAALQARHEEMMADTQPHGKAGGRKSPAGH